MKRISSFSTSISLNGVPATIISFDPRTSNMPELEVVCRIYHITGQIYIGEILEKSSELNICFRSDNPQKELLPADTEGRVFLKFRRPLKGNDTKREEVSFTCSYHQYTRLRGRKRVGINGISLRLIGVEIKEAPDPLQRMKGRSRFHSNPADYSFSVEVPMSKDEGSSLKGLGQKTPCILTLPLKS